MNKTARDAKAGVAVWCGDSTAFGAGASTPAKRYSTLASQALGLAERNYAKTGAGFETAGGAGDLLAQVGAAGADVTLDASKVSYVFLMAGLEDDAARLASIGQRVADTTAKARELFSGARIVVGCGPGCIPRDATDAQTEAQGRVLTAIELASDDADCLTIPDLRSVCGNDPDLRADGIDPNDKGHRAIADRIAEMVDADGGEPLDTPVTDLRRSYTAHGADWINRQYAAQRRREEEKREANRPTGTELTQLTSKLDRLTRRLDLQQTILRQMQEQLADVVKKQGDMLATQQTMLEQLKQQQATLDGQQKQLAAAQDALKDQQGQLDQQQSSFEARIEQYINGKLAPNLNSKFAEIDRRLKKLESGTPA